ncbi:MarR family winged helix-turn-helix transcriptional regulator [Agromyces archimandritae]|uniref:Winged helix-turn-helix transcriptional regulator n=1 Tax=Agromyces archimandritae TaxID=2781962 RepID=A0A975IMY2_9MICO|nr:MarR family winged helix-turn-helix transcriptional regulator [Agromyces archimandritae]QTX03649.1 winged helix-turn-helix transcriptional regulator [Agromyces archimandritae]
MPDPSDGRSTLAVLTATGREKVDDATPGHVETVHRLVLDRLTKAQTRQLREITKRIAEAIDDGDAWKPSTPGVSAS